MNRFQKRVGYAIAIVACTIVLLIRIALSDALAEQARLMPFVIAVMAAAWWGGLGPGIFATVLCALLGVLFIVPPENSILITTVADGVNAAIFVFLGISISFLCEALHKAHRAEAEKQFRTLADSIAQLVWMARPDGYRFWFNQRWRDYSGTTLEQIAGEGWQEFCDPAELPRVLASWNAAIAKGEAWEETYPLRGKDGQMRWHLARAVPIRDAQGEITCWFGTSTDIHDRIAIEQALKDADARKDQFMAMLAHELRNPLSPISNALQLWPHVAANPAEMDHLRTIMSRQVQQLVRLIDDLMDMARITSGKINLRCSPVDLGNLIARAVETVQPLMDASGHHLTVLLPKEPIVVNGDISRLTQVISNILNNAAKYTPRGGAISVQTEKRGELAVVTIRDNGLGIPPHLLTTVFDAFRQVDRPVDSSQGGLGIGLTLARQLMELHGGTIEASSDGPGMGSQFAISIPAMFAEPRDHEIVRAQPPHTLERRQILVVDDLHESAETLAKVLVSMGQDATPLFDGEAAITWILEHQPDIVLLDIAMPGLDGYEVARRLREHDELRSIVLVALTGYGQREDRRRALDAGFDEHLTKPADIAELEELLWHLSEESKAIASAAAD